MILQVWSRFKGTFTGPYSLYIDCKSPVKPWFPVDFPFNLWISLDVWSRNPSISGPTAVNHKKRWLRWEKNWKLSGKAMRGRAQASHAILRPGRSWKNSNKHPTVNGISMNIYGIMVGYPRNIMGSSPIICFGVSEHGGFNPARWLQTYGVKVEMTQIQGLNILNHWYFSDWSPRTTHLLINPWN